LRIFLTVAWLLCVLGGSFLSDDWKTILLTHGPFHLPIHFAVFAFSGVLVAGNADSFRGRVFLCSWMIGFAFILEALQRAIYPIRFEWRDFTADTAGVLCALFWVALSFSRRIDSGNPAKSGAEHGVLDPESTPGYVDRTP
jgi:hypothetical protein